MELYKRQNCWKWLRLCLLAREKRTHFDLRFIKSFCPPSFDSFEFLPSVGALGGSIIIWKGSSFKGTCAFQNSFAQSVELTSLHNGANWLLTNIYAPCTPSGKRDFLRWFKHIQIPHNVDWLILGDFNL